VVAAEAVAVVVVVVAAGPRLPSNFRIFCP
jgi:hypothetical protein